MSVRLDHGEDDLTEVHEINVTPFIDEAMERDPSSAQAEYLTEFRTDIESFVNRQAVAACVPPGMFERPPLPGLRYSAFTDPSGGSSDSFTLAIAHRDTDSVILDCLREVRPPFSPEGVIAEFAAVLKSYRISHVVGDRYAGEFPRELFRKCGIAYELSQQPKSDLYRDVLPLLNSKRVDLLDHPKLIAQLCGLERRTARSGRDSIDHGPGAHDDVANACAGALTVANKPVARIRSYTLPPDYLSPGTTWQQTEIDMNGRPIAPERTRVRWVRVREADARAARVP